MLNGSGCLKAFNKSKTLSRFMFYLAYLERVQYTRCTLYTGITISAIPCLNASVCVLLRNFIDKSINYKHRTQKRLLILLFLLRMTERKKYNARIFQLISTYIHAISSCSMRQSINSKCDLCTPWMCDTFKLFEPNGFGDKISFPKWVPD